MLPTKLRQTKVTWESATPAVQEATVDWGGNTLTSCYSENPVMGEEDARK